MKFSKTPVNPGLPGSIAAYYCEAAESENIKDFVPKIGIGKKEIKETRLWIRLLAKACPGISADSGTPRQESRELLLFFSKNY